MIKNILIILATLACVHTQDPFGNSRDSSSYANID